MDGVIHIDLLIANLTSPAVICFVIGALAALIKSDLRVPPQVHETISMYLLFAIGLKGGIALSQVNINLIMAPLLATLFLGTITPLLAFIISRYLGRLDVTNSAALAAHFGSVSAVTFMAALNFADLSQIKYEGFLTALLVLMEIPGIVIALAIAGFLANGSKVNLSHVLKEAFTGKSIILLAGGLFVGIVGDKSGINSISNVFVTPFQGVLVFFLLEMGFVAVSKLKEVKPSLPFMVAFGTLVPPLFGIIGAVSGTVAGLSPGGAAILATMTASASYIAAPAAVKMALPQANPSLYLTTSISITLPFNLILGIPLYFALAKWLGN
jgi:hypothetical protein